MVIHARIHTSYSRSLTSTLGSTLVYFWISLDKLVRLVSRSLISLKKISQEIFYNDYQFIHVSAKKQGKNEN